MEQFYKEPTPVVYSAAGFKRYHFARKTGLRLHWHDRMELIRFHEGKALVGYGDNTAELSAGGIYIVGPKIPHTIRVLGESVRYDVLMFDLRQFYNETQLCRDKLPAIFEGRVTFQLTTCEPAVVACFDRLYSLCEEPSLETTGLAYQLLDLLLRYAVLEYTDAPKGDPVILETLEYMQEHYAEELTVQQLAVRCGYSDAHFCRKFKQTTWMTPMKYLQIFRLEEAAKLLKQGRGNVSSVAMQCGFPDPNYFTRCFKQHFGVPPTGYETKRKEVM